MAYTGTKARILDAALDLFSVQGFEGVSVKQIAAAVGIKDSSLYKHFASKREIFDTLLEQMNERYAETAALYQLPQGQIVQMAKEYGRGDLVWLKKGCEAIFLFFLKDPQASRFRRMLMIEQYKNSEASATFQSWFVDSALHFQTALFGEMSKQGYFRPANPETMALQFYAPFFLLLCQYDGKPEKEGEAVRRLMAHVEQFAAVYQMESGENR